MGDPLEWNGEPPRMGWGGIGMGLGLGLTENKVFMKNLVIKTFVIFSVKLKKVVKDTLEAEIGDDFDDLGDISNDYL